MTEPCYPAQAYSSEQGDPIPGHRRNPSRDYNRDGCEIRPMDLPNAAQNVVRNIRAIYPPPCRHEGEVPLDWFPATMAARDVGLYLRCSACGR